MADSEELETAMEHFNLSLIASEEKDYDSAIRELDKCLCLNPTPQISVLAWRQLGFNISKKIDLYNRDRNRLYADDYVWIRRAQICYTKSAEIFEKSESEIMSKVAADSRNRFAQNYQAAKEQQESLLGFIGTRLVEAMQSGNYDEKVKEQRLSEEKAIQELPIIKCLAEQEKKNIEESKRLAIESTQKKSSCFIATAAYGSPLAPEVILLNRFRDEILLNWAFGKAFVAFYYIVSPPLASLIGKAVFLRAIVRSFLIAPILRLLKAAKFSS